MGMTNEQSDNFYDLLHSRDPQRFEKAKDLADDLGLRDDPEFKELIEDAYEELFGEEYLYDLVAREFSSEMEKLRRKHWANRITSWSLVGLGVLSSFCSLGVGAAVPIGTGISVALHVYQGLRGSDHVTEKRMAQQLLGDLKREIVRPTLLRNIALP